MYNQLHVDQSPQNTSFSTFWGLMVTHGTYECVQIPPTVCPESVSKPPLDSPILSGLGSS